MTESVVVVGARSAQASAGVYQAAVARSRDQREDDARHFIKRREPAYAARRRAKTSVDQEPEAESIDAEILGYHPVVPA